MGDTWTDEDAAKAHSMKDAGESNAKIGAAMGRTRNSVIGKMHRDAAASAAALALAPRPESRPTTLSPPAPRPRAIPAELAERATAPAKAPGFRSSPAAEPRGAADRGADVEGAAVPQPIAPPTLAPVETRMGPRKPPPTFAPAPPQSIKREPPILPEFFSGAFRVRLIDLEQHHCRWPFGDPGDPDFRHCGVAKAPLCGPYCAGHAKLAYTPRGLKELARKTA